MTSLLWEREGDQGMTWKEAKVNLPADGGLQHSLVFASDMVTENLRCAFSSQFDVITAKTSFTALHL